MKGIEVLVPDDISFQESKFILLQTGNIMARSRQPLDQRDQMTGFDLGPQEATFQQSHADPLFVNAIKQQIQLHSNVDLSDTNVRPDAEKPATNQLVSN